MCHKTIRVLRPKKNGKGQLKCNKEKKERREEEREKKKRNRFIQEKLLFFNFKGIYLESVGTQKKGGHIKNFPLTNNYFIDLESRIKEYKVGKILSYII